jgi:hypothetical protein
MRLDSRAAVGIQHFGALWSHVESQHHEAVHQARERRQLVRRLLKGLSKERI